MATATKLPTAAKKPKKPALPTADQLLADLNAKDVRVVKLSKKGGVYTARKSYFYRHGFTPAMLAERIMKAMPGVEIVATRDEFAPWPTTSYFRVDFKLPAAK